MHLYKFCVSQRGTSAIRVRPCPLDDALHGKKEVSGRERERDALVGFAFHCRVGGRGLCVLNEVAYSEGSAPDKRHRQDTHRG